MKILVTGSDTALGRDLMLSMSKDPEVMGVTGNSLNLLDAERVNELFAKYRPVAVIHADGMHEVDACEAEPWEALRRNVLSTQNLAQACLEHNAGLALMSTNHVFSGLKKGPYTEWDVPDPQNVLGHSKTAAEMVVRNHLQRFHIIRSQGLFSRSGDNFVVRTMASAAENTPVEAADDEFTLPTWSRDLAQAVTRLVRGRIYGVFHVTNSGDRNGVSWAAWARLILQMAGNQEHLVRNVSAQSLGRSGRRPARVILGNTFYRLQGFAMRGYDEALSSFLDDLSSDSSAQGRAARARRADLLYDAPAPP